MRLKGPERDLSKERQWRERVQRWERSGESVRAFCRGEGLHESAFYAWRRELARRRQERQALRAARKQAHAGPNAAATEPVRFLPVQVTAEKVAEERSGVEILLHTKRTIRVRPGFDRQTLRDVLAVLEALPC
jgi:transposase